MNAENEEMRFGFGRNWGDFIDRNLSDEVIADSQAHMSRMLRLQRLDGLRFLDIGCGSGIHALAALRLGAAHIDAFDYDMDSVRTSERVRAFADVTSGWDIRQGSILDKAFLAEVQPADIVYSWGVLHHTGDMWTAVANAQALVKPDGVFYIALYSSDNYVDPPPRYWLAVKQRYNRSSALAKRLMEWGYMLRFHAVPSLLRGQNPAETIRSYGDRGMTYWTDVRDWLGGWPMDFAGLHETRAVVEGAGGLRLCNVKTGEGCTEYVFADPRLNAHWRGIEAARSASMRSLDGPFVNVGGLCWAARVPTTAPADAPDAPRRSKLMAFEGETLLGIAHSEHAHIRRFGGGRFSHWGDTLLFSTLDGSDPNTNGRQYSICPDW